MRADAGDARPPDRVQAVPTAPPAVTMQREPQVPVEYGVIAVSPCTTRIALNGNPRISCATCASVVSRPCPWTLDANAQFQTAIGRHARHRLLETGHHGDAPAGVDRSAVRCLFAKDRAADTDPIARRSSPPAVAGTAGTSIAAIGAAQAFRVIATVEMFRGDIVVRHRVGGHEIAQANLVRFEAA